MDYNPFSIYGPELFIGIIISCIFFIGIWYAQYKRSKRKFDWANIDGVVWLVRNRIAAELNRINNEDKSNVDYLEDVCRRYSSIHPEVTVRYLLKDNVLVMIANIDKLGYGKRIKYDLSTK